MKKKESWREKKVNYKKIKLLSTIISICLIVAVMGIGVLASTQQYSAEVTNAVSMHFANLDGKVEVSAFADATTGIGDTATGMGASRPTLEATTLFEGGDKKYDTISSGETTSGENLQFAGADFLQGSSDLTSNTTKAMIVYIFKYTPVQTQAGVTTNTYKITETSTSALTGASGYNNKDSKANLIINYYITTEEVTLTTMSDVVALSLNNETQYEADGNQAVYVVATCIYENPSGLSFKINGSWNFTLDIETKITETTSLTSNDSMENNNLLNNVTVETQPDIIILHNLTSVKATTQVVKPNDSNYNTCLTRMRINIPMPTMYTITPTLTNVTADAGNPTSVAEGGTATLTFTANEGYNLPDNVTVTGATGNWNKATGTLTISNPTGNVSFEITGAAPIVNIKSNLNAYTWAEVKQLADALASGTLSKAELSSTYNISIGSTKNATINNETHSFRLVGINHDKDASGNTLGMTFDQVDLMNSMYKMKSSLTTTDSWSNSDLKTTISNFTIESSLDAVITSANKVCCTSVSQSGTVNVASKLWIMSETEMAGTQTKTYGSTVEGTQYEYWVGKSASDRLKQRSGSNYEYWLRSPCFGMGNGEFSYFADINGGGYIYSNNAIINHGVAVCFCI